MSLSLLAKIDFREVSYPKRDEIHSCLHTLHELFDGYFDQNWFILLLEELPIKSSTLAEIRELFDYDSPILFDAKKVYERIPVLEGFVNQLRHYLLPCLREKLGISGLLPKKIIRDKGQLLLRKFIAYTFPSNLDKLALLTEQLRACSEKIAG